MNELYSGSCWYCYWGWPEDVAGIYKRALSDLDGDEDPLLYGPAHVVWEDENWQSAERCLEAFDEYRGEYSDQQLDIVKRSLRELEAIPIGRRCVTPDNYTGTNPELYPPPAGIQMVKI